MSLLRLTLRPLSAFATPLQGDTLFGQLCWAIRHHFGEARLTALLQDYVHGRPFVVLSDAFPVNHVPLPHLPYAQDQGKAGQHKEFKRKIWLPFSALHQAATTWPDLAKAPDENEIKAQRHFRPQPHNSINRLTQTTDTDFAPFNVVQHWHEAAQLQLYAVLDEQRLQQAELLAALGNIGLFGYGKDASTGLGKFTVDSTESLTYAIPDQANAWLTLAPCAPQGLSWQAERCFYRPFVRYGRHGDRAALSGQPFKKPLLLAATGAVLSPAAGDDWTRHWLGQGLGGADQPISNNIDYHETVHQGYAPALPICLPPDYCHAEAS